MPGKPFLAKLSSRAATRSLRGLSKVTLANVLAGDTCSPISLAEFEAYLVFQEHSPENLQFVVWYQDYRKRFFDAQSQKPVASPGPDDFTLATPSTAAISAREERSRKVVSISNASYYDPQQSCSTPTTPSAPLLPRDNGSTPTPTAENFTHPIHHVPLDAEIETDERRPFKTECLRVIATFLQPGAPKELCLDSRVRNTAIIEATKSCHPHVFHAVYEECYHTLETSSLRHFLALSTANINRPKQLFWYAVGTVDLLIAIAIATCLILFLPSPPEKVRAWRLLSVPFAWFGTMQFYSAWRGFCNQVWQRGNTQLRPWELEDLDHESKDFIRQILRESFPMHTTEEQKSNLAILVNLPDGSFPPLPGYGMAIHSSTDLNDGSSSSNEKKRLSNPESMRVGFKRPPIFGPEVVVMDPLIKAVHRQVMNDILVAGLCGVIVFSAAVFSIPGYHVHL